MRFGGTVKKKNEPYIPLPFRSGNTIIKQYEDYFDDNYGHKAIITKVDYKDKKNKLIIGYVLYVKWL